MSSQWNRQVTTYVSKVTECLEQNIRKQIDNKKEKTIKYKASEQIIKYSSWNVEIQSC